MKRSDEQGVGLIIEGYFRASERGAREQQQKIVRISQIYAKQGWQRRLVHQTYSIFKKLLKRENFASLTKRLLAVWDELLETQVRKGSGTGYRNALSEIIVESYTFIFPLILEYRCLDLILDLKLYRMLWAKYISDESFFQLRTEIAKISRNFDLNKGLTAENIDKIRKRFATKGVTQEEIQNYMGVTQFDKRSDPSPSAQRKIERMRESSEEDQSDALRKRVKPDTIHQQHYSRVNYDGYNPEKYMYAGPNAAFPQQQQSFPFPQASNYMPRSNIPQGNLSSNYPQPPVSNQNLYPPYSRPYGGNFPPPPQNQQNPYQMTPGVSSTAQSYYSESKSAHFGSYPDYNSGYLPNYPQQSFNTQIPSFPTPSQPSTYIPQQQTTYANYPNPSTMYPPVAKIPPQTDFSLNPRELKRQSPQFTPKMGRSPMHGQAQYFPQVYDTASTKNEFRATSPERMHAEKGDKGKYRQLLASLKKGLSECRQCGVHFLSRQNLQQHKREHFNEAQRKFQAKQSQQIGTSLGIQRQKPKNRQNFDMLCTPSEWINGGNSSEGQAVYQVSIKRLPAMQRVSPVFNCYFCNEDMQVNWCSQLQEWTLNNGVKVYEQDRGLCVAHFDCYQCFRNEDASFHTAATQMVN